MKFKETKIGTIPNSWEVKPIKEITEIVTDYVANGSFASLAENVTYKDEEDVAVLIRLVDYNNDFQGKFVFIDEHAYEFLGKSKLYGDEIIISNVGANVGTVFRCPKLKYKMSLAPNSIMVKFKGNDDFYFHWLRGYNGQQMLKSIVTGSAQPKFNKTNFKEMLVPVPPIKEQNKIAAILNTIDEKISINKKINNNLQQQALTIYRELSKSEPTHSLGDLIVEMPKSRIKVGDAKGLTGEYPFFTSGKAVLSYPDALVSGRKIYLNTGGNADVKYYIGDASYSTDTWCIEGKSWATDYLYLALVDLLPEIEQTCFEGSALRHLQKGKLKSIPVYIPSVEERTHFLSTVKVLLEQQSKNIQENRKLSCLRDLLLPKLLSGEIDVSEFKV